MAGGHPLVLSVGDIPCLGLGVPGLWCRAQPGPPSCPLGGLFAQVQRVTGTDTRVRERTPNPIQQVWCLL